MATTTYKVLGQAQPAAGAAVDCYTVPAATQAVCSTLMVCNTGAAGVFAVRVLVAGKTYSDNSAYIFSGQAIAASQTIGLTAGLTLGPGDKVNVYCSVAGCSFNLFGQEIA